MTCSIRRGLAGAGLIVAFPLLLGTAVARAPSLRESAGSANAGELALPTLSEKESLSELLSPNEVEVASRRKQSIDEANVSISVITERDIELSGATNLGELMRLIPGSHVIQGTANNFSVGFRGISRPVNSHVLLLLNGIPQVRNNSGAGLWNLLPIQPADIKRIEITRGSSAMLFGRGAVSGAVNIVTKGPFSQRGLEASAWGQLGILRDTSETNGARLRNGGGAQLAYNWSKTSETLGVRVNLGINDAPDWLEANKTFHGPFQYAAMTSLEWRPRPDLDLFASLGHLHVERKVLESKSVPNLYYQNKQTLLLQLSKRRLFIPEMSLRIQGDLDRDSNEYAAQLPDGAPDALRVAGQGTWEAWSVHSTALLDLTLWNGRSMTTLGAEVWLPFRSLSADLDIHAVQLGGFLSTELKLLADRSLILNAGCRYDHIDWHSDGTLGDVRYEQLSPRLGLVWLPKAGHALRLTGSSSFYTPNASDTLMEIFLPDSASGDVPPVRLYVGNPKLKAEQLSSVELGYRGKLGDRFELDGTLFAQRVTDLLRDAGSGSPKSVVNAERLNQLGLELSLQYVHSRALSARAHYTFVYSADAETEAQLKDWPVHLGGLGLSSQLTDKLRASLNTYLVFDYAPLVPSLENLAATPFTLTERYAAPPHAFINLRLGHFLYQAEIFVAVKNLLGFFLDEADLRTYPRGADAIGGTLMLGLEIEGL